MSLGSSVDAALEDGPRVTRLMTADELADRWQVSKPQVYRLARSGEIPTVWIGRYCRFSPAAIEAFERGGADA